MPYTPLVGYLKLTILYLATLSTTTIEYDINRQPQVSHAALGCVIDNDHQVGPRYATSSWSCHLHLHRQHQVWPQWLP